MGAGLQVLDATDFTAEGNGVGELIESADCCVRHGVFDVATVVRGGT